MNKTLYYLKLKEINVIVICDIIFICVDTHTISSAKMSFLSSDKNYYFDNDM